MEFHLRLNYDPGVIQFEDVILNPALTGSITDGLEPGVFRLSYSTWPAIDLPDGDTLFTLEFTYSGPPIGATSLLTWPETPPEDNQYLNAEGWPYSREPFRNYFLDGSVRVDPPGCETFTLTCAGDATQPSCRSQADIDAAFAAWLATSTFSGGCDAAMTTDPPSPAAPDACGGSKAVTFTVTSACDDSLSCSATFTVEPADAAPGCPPASAAEPLVDGLLDESYQFFKDISLSSPSHDRYSRGVLYKFEDADYLWLAYVESRGVNDNVYGNSSADVSYSGWAGTHKFNDLLTGDKLQIQLYDQNSAKVFDVTLDYLFEQNLHYEKSYNSGLLKFMPEGAEAEKYDGSPHTALGYNNVFEAETSQDYNQTCNNSKYNSRSPGPPEEGCWEYRTIYEVKISKAGLGLPEMITDTSRIKIPLVNNSPSKNTTAISGFSYCDADHDSLKDQDEAGLEGMTIDLDGPVNVSTTTNANGFYEFFYIADGSYTVGEASQPGYILTQGPGPFTLASHQVARDKNFGNLFTNIILTCPGDLMAGPFATQSEADAAFAGWLAGATLTGCNVTLATDPASPASPDVCTGGTTTVTFIAEGCEANAASCGASFILSAPGSCPPVSTTPPVVDGLLDESYQFFKSVSLSSPGHNGYSRGILYKFEDAGLHVAGIR